MNAGLLRAFVKAAKHVDSGKEYFSCNAVKQCTNSDEETLAYTEAMSPLGRLLISDFGNPFPPNDNFGGHFGKFYEVGYEEAKHHRVMSLLIYGYAHARGDI